MLELVSVISRALETRQDIRETGREEDMSSSCASSPSPLDSSSNSPPSSDNNNSPADHSTCDLDVPVPPPAAGQSPLQSPQTDEGKTISLILSGHVNSLSVSNSSTSTSSSSSSCSVSVCCVCCWRSSSSLFLILSWICSSIFFMS